jgi:hypothetical protein
LNLPVPLIDNPIPIPGTLETVETPAIHQIFGNSQKNC